VGRLLRAAAARRAGALHQHHGRVDFDPLDENPRAALLLANDSVYLSWGSSCDVGPYHGWLIAYDAHTLAQQAVSQGVHDLQWAKVNNAALLAADPKSGDVLAWVGESEVVGVDPAIMGIGPVPATRRLLERTKRALGDFDLIELNEAFAAQVLACDRELHMDRSRLNVNGGAIALGHPIGCTGARIVTTLVHEMKRRKARLSSF